MALPPTLSSWQLNLNANCLPDSMAPGSTMAFHFIEQLVANSARNGSEAAENMRKFGQRLLADQGWQSVEDIRNGVTEPMLSTAAAACGVGAGYYMQFLRHLGGPDGQWNAKKPGMHETRKGEVAEDKGYKPMKYEAVANEFPSKLSKQTAREVLLPFNVFDGVFGNGIGVVLPYNHALTRPQQTEVVNRYVLFVMLKYNVIAPSTDLLEGCTADFKSKFPILSKWAGKTQLHGTVLRNGWRNRRVPPAVKDSSYRGLTISESDHAASAFARALMEAGFPLTVDPLAKSYLSPDCVEVPARAVEEVVSSMEPRTIRPIPVPNRHARLLTPHAPRPPQDEKENNNQLPSSQTVTSGLKHMSRTLGAPQAGRAGSVVAFGGLNLTGVATPPLPAVPVFVEPSAAPVSKPAAAKGPTTAKVSRRKSASSNAATTPEVAAKPRSAKRAKPTAAEPFYSAAAEESGDDDDLFLDPLEHARKYGSTVDWKYYESKPPPLPLRPPPFVADNAIGRTFVLSRDYPPFSAYAAAEDARKSLKKGAFLGWMGTSAKLNVAWLAHATATTPEGPPGPPICPN